MSRALSIVVILGSVRPRSNSRKAVAVVLHELQQHNDLIIDFIDPRAIPLTLPGLEENDAVSESLKARVRHADGVILVTPEYDGSYSSVIKLVIEHLGYPSTLAGKPIGILGLASGRIGAIRAVEHLRNVCTNIGAFVLPYSQSVAAVHHMFDAQGHCSDPAADQSIRQVPRDLVSFLRKLDLA